jgi:hypothetical protein
MTRATASQGGCAPFLFVKPEVLTMEDRPTHVLKTDPVRTFATSLYSFESTARNVRRSFQVAMAVNVFGVGTLLPNDLPKNAKSTRQR